MAGSIKRPRPAATPAAVPAAAARRDPLADVEPPPMRLVDKGWTYREQLETAAQVRARQAPPAGS